MKNIKYKVKEIKSMKGEPFDRLKSYDALKKKFDLPDYDDLDNEFEISLLEEAPFPLRNIRRKIAEKVDFYTRFLEEQLQPEATLPLIHECKYFTDEEKSEMFKFYMKLMLICRASAQLGIEEDDKKTAAFIVKTLKEWKEMKLQLSGYVKKVRDAWKKDITIIETLGYLG
jgi:hypothetical protein